MLASRNLSGAKIALIIHIDAVRDRIESVFSPKSFHYGEQLIFTMKTAGGVVAHVFGSVEFAGADDFERNTLLASKSDGLGEMGTSQTGRIGNHCKHICAQCSVS